MNPSSVSSLKRNQIWLPNSPIQNDFLDCATWPISLGNSTKGTKLCKERTLLSWTCANPFPHLSQSSNCEAGGSRGESRHSFLRWINFLMTTTKDNSS